ncbi:amidase [Acidisphaera sp. L21]|uniref:amidase family protein n=1 Tax=Acidisphaera sp. L21 TaxID=1641851 RepID=UPI00131E7C94|nr:amidase [Acidisphaera sp. L21]
MLEDCLENIAQWEPVVGAFTAMNVDAARQAADAATARWRAGQPKSAIDGMVVGVKDMIDTGDLPTGMGSPLYDGYTPRFDAASVQGLREAGAVILGKTVTTEFASSQPRSTRNPWDPARTPGGSSSGSAAAVGTGMLCGALGTQVVGSISRPAGYCGAYGYKPTPGGINRGGSLDFLSQSVTDTIAATLGDAWVMARAIVERVGGDPGMPGITGPLTPPAAQRPLRLALIRTAGWPSLQPAAQASLETALETLCFHGITILTRETCPALAAVEAATVEARVQTLIINAWKWRWPLGSYVATDHSNVSASSRDRHIHSNTLTQNDYSVALARRAAARATLATLLQECDALVSITAAGGAPVGLEKTGDPIFVVPGSYLGVPGVALPVLEADGLPLGLQLLGAPGADAALSGHAAFVDDLLRI